MTLNPDHRVDRGHALLPLVQALGKAHRLLDINVQRFRGGLVFKAHRLVYHSTLGLRVIKKKKKKKTSARYYLHPEP